MAKSSLSACFVLIAATAALLRFPSPGALYAATRQGNVPASANDRLERAQHHRNAQEMTTRLAALFAGHEYVYCTLCAPGNANRLYIGIKGYGFESWFGAGRAGDAWRFTVRRRRLWRVLKNSFLERAGLLWQCRFSSVDNSQSERGPAKKLSLVFHKPRQHRLSLHGALAVNLTSDTQRYLKIQEVSRYPATRRVLIFDEPHEKVKAQFAVYKGLKRLFESNQGLLFSGQVVFLSEGTPAGKPVDVRELIERAPRPSDSLIRYVLSTYLIPGYVAYEWKSRKGIPIIGMEDPALYRISSRLAGLRPKNGAGAFFYSKSVAARNASFVHTLVNALNEHECPVMFVGAGHLNTPPSKLTTGSLDNQLSRFKLNRDEVRRVNEAGRRGVRALLKERRIGFYLIAPRRYTFAAAGRKREAAARYAALLRSQSDKNMKKYIQDSIQALNGCTTQPSPGSLEELLKQLAKEIPKAFKKAFQEAASQALESSLSTLLDKLALRESRNSE